MDEAQTTPVSWEGFSLHNDVLAYERGIIERALTETGGSVTKAARLLGYNHHQSLIAVIDSRHSGLPGVRLPKRPRRKALIGVPRSGPKSKLPVTITILHVEDNEQVANLLRELLVEQRWKVDRCHDAESALVKLSTNGHYDVLLTANELPGMGGLELVRQARRLRSRLPIVMTSGGDCDSDAWAAGVDAFLEKPQQIGEVAPTIARALQLGRQAVRRAAAAAKKGSSS